MQAFAGPTSSERARGPVVEASHPPAPRGERERDTPHPHVCWPGLPAYLAQVRATLLAAIVLPVTASPGANAEGDKHSFLCRAGWSPGSGISAHKRQTISIVRAAGKRRHHPAPEPRSFVHRDQPCVASRECVSIIRPERACGGRGLRLHNCTPARPSRPPASPERLRTCICPRELAGTFWTYSLEPFSCRACQEKFRSREGLVQSHASSRTRTPTQEPSLGIAVQYRV